MKCGCSMDFSMGIVRNMGLTALKSPSNIRISSLVPPSKIFVCDSDNGSIKLRNIFGRGTLRLLLSTSLSTCFMQPSKSSFGGHVVCVTAFQASGKICMKTSMKKHAITAKARIWTFQGPSSLPFRVFSYPKIRAFVVIARYLIDVFMATFDRGLKVRLLARHGACGPGNLDIEVHLNRIPK